MARSTCLVHQGVDMVLSVQFTKVLIWLNIFNSVALQYMPFCCFFTIPSLFCVLYIESYHAMYLWNTCLIMISLLCKACFVCSALNHIMPCTSAIPALSWFLCCAKLVIYALFMNPTMFISLLALFQLLYCSIIIMFAFV